MHSTFPSHLISSLSNYPQKWLHLRDHKLSHTRILWVDDTGGTRLAREAVSAEDNPQGKKKRRGKKEGACIRFRILLKNKGSENGKDGGEV
jgi:hypothetical protein